MTRLLLLCVLSLPTLAHASECDTGQKSLVLAELPLTAAPHTYEARTHGNPSFLKQSEEDVPVPAVLDEWGNVLVPARTETRIIPNMFHGEYFRLRISERRDGGNGVTGYALLLPDGRQACHFATIGDFTDWRYAHLRPEP